MTVCADLHHKRLEDHPGAQLQCAAAGMIGCISALDELIST